MENDLDAEGVTNCNIEQLAGVIEGLVEVIESAEKVVANEVRELDGLGGFVRERDVGRW
jgi:hypothetical protein